MDSERIEEWTVCFFFESHEPDTFVDISDTIDAEIEAFCSHVSQFGRRVEGHEAEMHPEDRAAFEEGIRGHCARLGEPYGMAYAEGFRRSTDH